jgi:hypothetical protein
MEAKKSTALAKLGEVEHMITSVKDSTLPIDATAEWSKGFDLVNKIITLLADEKYETEIEDESGTRHRVTKIPPELIMFIKERRMLLDQIYRISGGEAINEAKKEAAKNIAKAIFEYSKDKSMKQKYVDVMQGIEAEDTKNADD